MAVVLSIAGTRVTLIRRAASQEEVRGRSPQPILWITVPWRPVESFVAPGRLLPVMHGIASDVVYGNAATRVLRGSALARRLRAEIAAARLHLERLGGAPPILATLLVGRNAPAEAYRASIVRTFAKVDIGHRAIELPANISGAGLISAISRLNDDLEVTGVLVLMPLPEHLAPATILEHLTPLKDVDGITPTNAGRLHLGLPSLRPSTPAGGLELLDFHQIHLPGTSITVVGRSNVVGRPLATLLTQRHATVTLCHRQTVDLPAIVNAADIVCVAAGHPGLITGAMVKRGATVLDFGVNVSNDGMIVGDADFDSLLGIAGAITPVPGGTGPVTALMLARNTISAAFAGLRGSLDDVLFELPEAMVAHLGEPSP